MNYGHNRAERISVKATRQVEKLEAEIKKIIEADLNRKPHLNESEKAEIQACEMLVAELTPKVERLQKDLEKLDEKRAYLVTNEQALVIDGADVAQLVSERQVLEKAHGVLTEAFRTVYSQKNDAQQKIVRIVDDARRRETNDEWRELNGR